MLDYVSESIVENFLLMLDLELKTLTSDGGCCLQNDAADFSPDSFHREIRTTLLYKLLSLTTFSSDGSQGHIFSNLHGGGGNGGGGAFDDFATCIAAVILRARDSKNSAKAFVDAVALRHFGLNDEGVRYLHRCGFLPPLDQVDLLQRQMPDDKFQAILKRVDGSSFRYGGGKEKDSQQTQHQLQQRVSTEPEAIFRLATEAYDTGNMRECSLLSKVASVKDLLFVSCSRGCSSWEQR